MAGAGRAALPRECEGRAAERQTVAASAGEDGGVRVCAGAGQDKPPARMGRHALLPESTTSGPPRRPTYGGWRSAAGIGKKPASHAARAREAKLSRYPVPMPFRHGRARSVPRPPVVWLHPSAAMLLFRLLRG